MATNQGLSVRARRLAYELKRLREMTGLSVEQAAGQLRWSYSKLNRFENRRAIPTTSQVKHILALYGVEPQKHDSILNLAREAHERGWWEDLGVFTCSYVGLEDAASVIRAWRPLLIPGLLQTEDYARAIIAIGLPDPSPGEIQQRVRARIARKLLLSRPEAPEFHAILGEAALRQQVGGREVMRDQLNELLAVQRKRSNVSIRVVPFEVGANIGLEGAFTYLEFADPLDPAVSYTEDLAGETYVESAERNRRIRLAFDRISDAALSPEDSAMLIADLTEEQNDAHVQRDQVAEE